LRGEDASNATSFDPGAVQVTRGAPAGTRRVKVLIRRGGNRIVMGMIVTMERLTKAFSKRLEVEPAQAKSLAYRVLNYFGYSNTIIDNLVDQEDRKLFYQLHDAGLLHSSWETTLLLNGKSWRIFYWQLNLDDIRRIADEGDDLGGDEPLYERLPSEVWSHAAAT